VTPRPLAPRLRPICYRRTAFLQIWQIEIKDIVSLRITSRVRCCTSSIICFSSWAFSALALRSLGRFSQPLLSRQGYRNNLVLPPRSGVWKAAWAVRTCTRCPNCRRIQLRKTHAAKQTQGQHSQELLHMIVENPDTEPAENSDSDQ